MTGRFIAIVGASGVGKDSVMEALAARDPGLVLARRVITRPVSAGGERFEGVTMAQFKSRAASGDFVLSWEAHGLHYAIPRSFEDHIQDGKDVLANLSRAVLGRAKDRFDRFEVFNLTADRSVLAKRLAGRGREDADQIARRLQRATFELPPEIDAHQIDNSGAMETTVQSILARLYPVRIS